MATERDQQSGESSGGTPAETADAETGSGTDVSNLPLPPYASQLGPPQLHFLQQMWDTIDFIERTFAERDVVRTRVPSQGDVFGLGHPRHMKRVLLTDREQFRKSEDFRIAFGEGLLTVEGEEWEQQRDVLQPLFTRQSVMGYADGMVEQVRRRSRRWQDGDRLVLQQAFTDMTLDVIFATVLGRELAIDGDQRIRDAAEHLHDWFVPTSYVLPKWLLTPARYRFKKAKETLEAEADRLLAEKRGGEITDPAEADDLLSLLVGLREAGVTDSAMLSDERLRDQMVTIIFAGHDTTTTTLTFACWALANNPEVYDRFLAEVDELDGPPTMDDLDDLEVTERVITETLRLFPPVYMLPREADTDLAVDGYRVPEGSVVNIPIRQIHRDERFYDDPESFRPGRWDGDLRQELPDFAYAPFGGGPRICIGRQFALLEAKLTLATIGREYKLYWLGENDGAEPPTSPQMTLRMAADQEFLVTER